MKVLSLLQPWATLVVIGAKKFETRSWPTQHRGPLLIHASKRFGKSERELVLCEPFYDALGRPSSDSLPTGAIIGRVDLVDCITTDEWFRRNTENGTSFQIKYESGDEFEFGDYSPGRFAWELANPVKFDQPITAKGSLGIWEFPESVLGHLAENHQ